MIRSKRSVGGSLAIAALAALAMIGLDGTRADQVVNADSWTFYLSNLGSGCESSCCGGMSLCCDVPANCEATET